MRSRRRARIDTLEQLGFRLAPETRLPAREGAAHLAIDPLMKTLEVFRLDGDSYRLVTTYRGSARVRVEPFDAFELERSSLWTK